MSAPKVYDYKEHKIDTGQIATSTLWVVRRLQTKGYQAYVVGGCLRDLLLNKKPKDFDVATNAHPQQVKKFFPHAIIIGRRFQLVHIFSGKDIVEVSTFRSKPARLSQFGRLFSFLQPRRHITENTFGTLAEDVTRRDLTINAFYYDPDKRNLLDYVGGYEDIKNKRVNIVGEPEERFREDPMRMIRMIRFMAKLDLEISPQLVKVMAKYSHYITQLPPARLMDEMQKLFLTGHGYASFCKLEEYDLLKFFLPDTAHFLKHTPNKKELCHRMIEKVLSNADERHHTNQSVTLALLCAVFLWFPYLEKKGAPPQAGGKISRKKEYEEHKRAVYSLASKRKRGFTIPAHLFYRTEKIWRLQILLLNYNKINQQKLMENKNFRIAYDFLRIYATIEPAAVKAAQWWEAYQAEYPTPRRKKHSNFQNP